MLDTLLASARAWLLVIVVSMTALFLAMLLSDKIGSDLGASAAVTPRNAAADAIRSKIQRDLEPKGSDPRGSV